MKTFTAFLALAVLISACGKGITVPVDIAVATPTPNAVTPVQAFPPVAAVPRNTPTPTASPTGTPSPSPSASPTVTLTVYSMTETQSSSIGGFPILWTATGFCFTYLGRTYCGDDGLHHLVWSSTLSAYFSFFEMLETTETTPTTDLLSTPQALSDDAINHIAGIFKGAGSPGLQTVAEVLLRGSAQNVSCIESGTTLNCGTFTVDTSGVGL